jgi:U2 small nuclear ribonucleoprotein B''
MPSASGAANVEVTQLQQSIFNAPAPGSAAATATGAAGATSHGLPAKPPIVAQRAVEEVKSPDSRGQKRTRDEESEAESDEDSEGDVAMDEDSDDD